MIILCGASASGKTVTALELEKKYGIKKAVTTTTRPMRDGERNGIEYFFINKEEFEKRLKEGKFVESSLYNGNYYGCGIDQVADDRVVVLDPNGLKNFKKLKNKNIVTFLLVCDAPTRENRMKLRGDKLENIKSRLENDVTSFAKEKIGDVDFVIQSDNQSIEETAKIIYEKYTKRLSQI